jgi:DNA ligase D-like protein (predicted 3'-phosphoesterase)
MIRGLKKIHSGEPACQKRSDGDHLRFVVHCKDCKEQGDLHYGFTLELNGVKTWAVPEGPSMDPLEQRHASEDRENHTPLDSEDYPGMEAWDKGNYIPIDGQGHPLSEHQAIECLKEGILAFFLQGKKLVGEFVLMRKATNNWLLMKRHDEFALYNDYSMEVLAT